MKDKIYALLRQNDGWRVIVEHENGGILGLDGKKYRLADFFFYESKAKAQKALNKLKSDSK